jgi:pilus assembly protein Flp/PilA
MMKKPSFMDFSGQLFGVNGRVNSRLIPIAFHLPCLLCYRTTPQSVLEATEMLKNMRRFLKNESGAAAIEYGLLASGISVVIIPGVKDVGAKLVSVFTLLQNAI